MPDTRLPVALLGAGWIATRAYLPELVAHPSLRLGSIYDPSPEIAGTGVPGSRRACSPQECLTAPTGAAIICAPAGDHLSLIEMALTAGLFVLCEKPVLRSLAEVASLNAGCGRERLMGSATMRLRTDVAHLLEAIGSGALGSLRRIRLTWLRHQGVPFPGSWRTRALLSPGGVLEDLGPHLLDIAVGALRASGAEPEGHHQRIQSVLQCRSGGHAEGDGARWFAGAASGGSTYDAPDYCAAELTLASGCLLSMEVAWTDRQPGDYVRIDVEGSEGRAGLEGLLGFSTNRRVQHQSVEVATRQGNERRQFSPGPESQQRAFAASLDRFAAFCAGKKEAISSADDITVVAGWMEAIRTAAKGAAA